MGMDRAEHPRRTETNPIGVVDSLTVRAEAAAAVGSTLLSSGMASYRVKAAMARTGRALGLTSLVSIVTYTDITSTATMDGRFRTLVTQPDHVGVDVDRMARTQRMVETIPAGVDAAEVHARLARITTRGPLYGDVVNALAAGIACAAFCFLNRGGPVEMACVLVAATIGQALRRVMQRRHWNHLLITLLAGAVTSAVYVAAILVPASLGATGDGHAGGLLAAVLFLVPGFPLITGLLDIVRSDFSAGVARLAYSAAVILTAAAAVWTVGLVAGLSPQTAEGLTLPLGVELPLRALATFAGVVGFAVIFNSPWGIAFAAATISCLANSGRFLLTSVDVPDQLATLAATVLVGVLAYVVAVWRHVPRTGVSVPAVVIMIPGYTLYTAFTLMNSGDVASALVLTQDAVQVILAAGLGLALAHLATSPAWRRVSHPH